MSSKSKPVWFDRR